MSAEEWNTLSLVVLFGAVVLRLIVVGGYGRGAPMWATFYLPTLGIIVMLGRMVVSRSGLGISPFEWESTVVFVIATAAQVPGIVASWWPRSEGKRTD